MHDNFNKHITIQLNVVIVRAKFNLNCQLLKFPRWNDSEELKCLIHHHKIFIKIEYSFYMIFIVRLLKITFQFLFKELTRKNRKIDLEISYERNVADL